ncbi:GntR family transcriptional regulator [Paramicrobacterium chengjingii]|uniref:GntR family transcriptional regulator n=1 Tax=Paramicrobacterium chengjingii TaxID=2769067 RepID=UPI001421BD5F|nr:GntR family transcriptional regulator [Microbacterium chengjingii]
MALAMLGGVVPASRTLHVLEIIKAGILNGDLAEGQPLVEAEIANELGVSKTPVREALKSLEGTGLVVIRPYTGAVVRTFTKDDALAIYDIRLLLEPEAVRRTVALRGDFSSASHALADAAAAGEYSKRSIANRDFHRALYAGCGNPLLVQTLDGLRDQTALVSVSSWARDASWDDEASEHRQILDAAERGAADTCAELVARHIKDFTDRRIRPIADGGAAKI